MLRYLLRSLLAGLLLLALPLSASAAQHEDASLTVIHGIPDVTVDVYVNDTATLTNFTFGTVTDPISLRPGTYKLALRPAGADPASNPILSAEATLQAGQNASVIAHLTAGGQPQLSLFTNDVSPLAANQARLVVRHTAAAPAVDVRAGGQVLFGNLANPDEAKADVPAETYQVDLVPAGQSTVVFGPVDLTLQPGVATIVFAVGSLQQGNFQLLIQTIRGLGPAPTEAATGAAAPSGTAGEGLPVLLTMLLLTSLLAVSIWLRQRSRVAPLR